VNVPICEQPFVGTGWTVARVQLVGGVVGAGVLLTTLLVGVGVAVINSTGVELVLVEAKMLRFVISALTLLVNFWVSYISVASLRF
jgi:hypothetical protein